jgi:hypothetical protein
MENQSPRLGYRGRSPTQLIMGTREYEYVGPREFRDAAKSQPSGSRIISFDDLRAWLTSTQTDRSPDGTYIATFTIDVDGGLLLAPRRSEHVACASGGPVLSAGEIGFDDELTVTEITNQSTGFCPEPESWANVATALDRIGIRHPGRLTTEVVFRLCPSCGERNIVKDDWYYCTICDADLPRIWNFSRNANVGEQCGEREPPMTRDLKS